MIDFKPKFRWFSFIGVVLFYSVLSGCVSSPKGTEETAPLVKGVYHKVLKGETLWRIAKAYDVSLERIIEVNRIPDVAQVEENQLILIPGADEIKVLSIIPEDTNKDEFSWPVNGKVINYFGGKSFGFFNRGISIAAEEGDPVYAARSGRVVLADYLPGYANTVIIDHEDGLLSLYAQNSKLLVKKGEQISKGSPIAYVGRGSGQAFLYFEIRRKSLPENPLFYLPR